ncbi:hypothetical protein P7C70_g8675, partial [Phenoliferia sp. Uapishka_3]
SAAHTVTPPKPPSRPRAPPTPPLTATKTATVDRALHRALPSKKRVGRRSNSYALKATVITPSCVPPLPPSRAPGSSMPPSERDISRSPSQHLLLSTPTRHCLTISNVGQLDPTTAPATTSTVSPTAVTCRNQSPPNDSSLSIPDFLDRVSVPAHTHSASAHSKDSSLARAGLVPKSPVKVASRPLGHDLYVCPDSETKKVIPATAPNFPPSLHAPSLPLANDLRQPSSSSPQSVIRRRVRVKLLPFKEWCIQKWGLPGATSPPPPPDNSTAL